MPRARWALFPLAVALVFAPTSVAAQSPEPPSDEASDPDAPAGDDSIRRDPNGQKGISPYMEDVAAGTDAFVKGNAGDALAAFDRAIAKDAERVLAYLLKAQVQLDGKKAEEALATLETARTKGGTALEQSKLLFLTAEAEEQKANAPSGSDNEPSQLEALKAKWERVKAQWAAYASFLDGKDDGKVPSYAATATERQEKIDARVKRDTDYAAVKKRIADNAAARDKK